MIDCINVTDLIREGASRGGLRMIYEEGPLLNANRTFLTVSPEGHLEVEYRGHEDPLRVLPLDICVRAVSIVHAPPSGPRTVIKNRAGGGDRTPASTLPR